MSNLAEQKISAKSAFPKLFYVLLSFLLQISVFLAVFILFRNNIVYFYAICGMISLGTILYILYDEKGNPSFKIAWLIPISLMPIFGGILYLIFGKYRMTKKEKAVAQSMRRQILNAVTEEKSVCANDIDNKRVENMSHFIYKTTGSLPYRNTKTRYFSSGEAAFPNMLEDLKQAQEYIFMEYFIIQEGLMWNSILEILKDRVAHGVEVRLTFDDFGCVMTLPRGYEKELEAMGIKVCVINRLNNFMNPAFNNRDHRKICVVDGKVAYTGGFNLADEYINEEERFGYWKDTGIRMEGRAAWSLAIQYLVMWGAHTGKSESFMKFHPNPRVLDAVESDGMVQPFTDIPLAGEHTGKVTYLNLINNAERYLYFTTPYLVPDYEILMALRYAAISGVDVRIYTPHIPDKKTVFKLTRSYYEILIEAGVKIYEFTPGFIHAKMMVSDDEKAVIGTINMDYRSLYLHTENGVFLYQNSTVQDIRDDILEMEKICEKQVVQQRSRLTNLPYHILIGVLRTFAPLL